MQFLRHVISLELNKRCLMGIFSSLKEPRCINRSSSCMCTIFFSSSDIFRMMVLQITHNVCFMQLTVLLESRSSHSCEIRQLVR
jgi:hypothetical protein